MEQESVNAGQEPARSGAVIAVTTSEAAENASKSSQHSGGPHPDRAPSSVTLSWVNRQAVNSTPDGVAAEPEAVEIDQDGRFQQLVG